MKAVLAEKPSVAREIAALLGATNKKDGYLTGSGYCVTWALGHLVGLGMPEDYGISGFDPDTLPILPDPFLLTARKVKKDKGYITDAGAVRQLEIIRQVIKQCESIIVATDAGREGELIFRYIYEYLNCQKPFERLWISSLTEKAIRGGLENLKPGSEFDGLYHAAVGRSRADWLVGINASQALSIAAGDGGYSLGRVQTPTMALICKRYLENKDFSLKKFWQVQLSHSMGATSFKSLSKDKWEEQNAAQEAFTSVTHTGKATITNVESKSVTEQPPLLFDLTGLQKEANIKLNLPAEETLNIAQGLYEKRFITYPRTGSKYIPEDQWPEIPNLVRILEDRPSLKGAVAKIKWAKLNKRIVDGLKVTDHHGLLITDRVPSALGTKENAIYDLIAFRLLEAVSPACIKEVTDVSLKVSDYNFGLKGSKVIEPGWRAIRGSFPDDDSALPQDLPELKTGEKLKINSAEVVEKQTAPPALYTEAGLLSAMETAGKDSGIEEERKALRNIGIGTPATRAAIIETLFSRGYIRREKKSLVPTDKGLQVYTLVKDKAIADVAMTAQWEITLQMIENNEADAGTFQKEIEQFSRSITTELLNTSIDGEKFPALTCPKCKSHVLAFRDRLVKCPGETCNWVQFRKVCEVQLTVAAIEALVTTGRTPLIKGMKSKSGKKFDAYITLNSEAQSSFEFENRKNQKQ